jgi:hypothetical protein
VKIRDLEGCGPRLRRPPTGHGLAWIHRKTRGPNVRGRAQIVRRRWAPGAVLGGREDLKIPFIRISGELRYTHQGSADFEALSNLNQAGVLIGVDF